MAFEDLARHMKTRDGGKMSTSTDPNLMMVEASKRAQSSQRTSDLILGPILLVAGLVMVVLGLTVWRGILSYYWFAAGGLLVAGYRQLHRGLFRFQV